MAAVSVTNVIVRSNPTGFNAPFSFEITFECLQELEDDLEWRMIYVGSAEDSVHDQVLEEVMVGPVPIGVNQFVLESPAPDPAQIPAEDLLGVTVVFLTCSYRDAEFVRIGYYVNNEYYDTPPIAGPDGAALPQPVEAEAVPRPIDTAKLYRNILAERPRVTRFPIDWGPAGAAPPAAMDGAEAAPQAVAGVAPGLFPPPPPAAADQAPLPPPPPPQMDQGALASPVPGGMAMSDSPMSAETAQGQGMYSVPQQAGAMTMDVPGQNLGQNLVWGM